MISQQMQQARSVASVVNQINCSENPAAMAAQYAVLNERREYDIGIVEYHLQYIADEGAKFNMVAALLSAADFMEWLDYAEREEAA